MLSNIYLDRLDRYVEQTIIPAYTEGHEAEDEPGRTIKLTETVEKTGRRPTSGRPPACASSSANPIGQ